MKKLLISTLVAMLAILGVSYASTKLTVKKSHICNQQYALCSAAQCTPNPKNPNQSICFCEVFEGINYGYSSCDERMPKTDPNEARQVISTFSLENFDTYKNMTCPSGNPWSNCLDQPCIVDPLDPKKAICMCKIVRSGEFVTFGGGCDTSTCSKGFWSAATPHSNAQAVQKMMQALGLKTSPQKFCPKNYTHSSSRLGS